MMAGPDSGGCCCMPVEAEAVEKCRLREDDDEEEEEDDERGEGEIRGGGMPTLPTSRPMT